MTDTDVVPRVRPGLRVRNFRGRLLIAHQEQALELSDTAAFIYRHIDGKRTVGDLGRLVAAEYDAPVETAVEDAAELLETLHEAHIVEL
jgi:hypothetical protein